MSEHVEVVIQEIQHEMTALCGFCFFSILQEVLFIKMCIFAT